MIIDVAAAFPNMKFFPCPSCEALLACKEEDILEFTNNELPEISIKGVVCPLCDKLMIIEDESEQSSGEDYMLFGQF